MSSINNKYKSKYEVLAPAGSYTCMVAAFNAGADAVYLAGNQFGARASANNFNDEELLAAIEYAHIRGKKIFLTVNTLLKNEQIYKQLFSYIEPLYKAGLDAVIVQDFGVMEFIRNHFPKLDIHASTQMTVTGPEFAKKLKDNGVSRIVPARELSLEEIKKIYNATGVEIECFVHGALCYCYSGMCLLSSVIGGRSGNRGRCAQPCRLPYDISFNDNKDKNINKKHVICGKYPLSPADLCTLHIIPDILEAGVYSLKIEGRMKKPEYVAIVTAMYRKYVDMYEMNGRTGYKVDNNDINMLKDIYNRGEFTDGYYKRHNGSSIMSVKRPNHMGTKAAVIQSINPNKREITAKACEDINDNDVLEIFLSNGETLSVKAVKTQKNRMFTTKLLTGAFNKSIENLLKSSQYIMRTRNNELISKIDNEYISNETIGKIKIGGAITVCSDTPVTFDVWCDDVYVHMEGAVPQTASNRPVSAEDIAKQINKTGATDFVFDSDELTISVDDNLFINIKELNQLRRDVLDELRHKLKDKISVKYGDRAPIKSENEVLSNSFEISSINNKTNNNINNTKLTSVYVSTKEQFDVALNSNQDILAFEIDICSNKELNNSGIDVKEVWRELIELAHKHNKQIFMSLPYVFRSHGKTYMEKNMEFFKENNLDGYVFRNMEEISWFETNDVDKKKIIFDNTVYGFNNMALNYMMKYNPYLITASFELNMRELKDLQCDRLEMSVYGYMPVMVSAGCIKKTYDRCNGIEESTILKDRLGNEFICNNHCSFCYNIIYNSRPLKLADLVDDLSDNFICHKYLFTTESGFETKKILEGQMEMEFTRGHYKRGVE